MYQILVDDKMIYSPQIKDLAVVNPVLNLELNTNGMLTFGIPVGHPNYNDISKLKSVIKVKKDGNTIFIGRAIEENLNWYGTKEYECEGCLAYFNDSVIEPYDFSSGTLHTSVVELLTYFISQHNLQVETSKQFKIGNIDTFDDYIVRSNSYYQSTYENIKGKLLDSFGGYLMPRYENDGIYIDYLESITEQASQTIAYGSNLASLTRKLGGADVITCIIPIGARNEETGQYLTIASVNDGRIILENQSAIAEYGRITKVVNWDGVTTASALKQKGLAYLQEYSLQSITLDVNAFDLSNIDAGFSSFKLGTYVTINDDVHSINTQVLISKLSLHMSNPAQDTLVLSKSLKGATSLLNDQGSEAKIIAEESYADVVEVKSDVAEVKEQTQVNTTWIEQNGNKVEITASSLEELEGIVNNQQMHLIVTADGVYISQSGTLQNATKITNTGMEIIVNNQIVASATNEMFNCSQGLGVNKWNFTEGSNEFILNISRTGD